VTLLNDGYVVEGVFADWKYLDRAINPENEESKEKITEEN
jgi:hypothetical protein